jgi:hypothetical protein
VKLFTTTDIAGSVRKAYEEFTHVALNRGYTIIKPVFFNTGTLDGLPTLQYASWIPASGSQLTRWKNLGGVLIEQDTHPAGDYKPDVTVMVECPYDMIRLKACNERNGSYGVVPHPGAWRTHEECVDLRFPSADALREIWTVAGGQAFTNNELASETNIPVSRLQYLKNSLHPKEMWYVQKRLAPEREEFMQAWDWLEGGTVTKIAVREAGFKAQVEEMARFGYINLKKMQHYPQEEPDWKTIDRQRERALTSLASVRSLVDSLDDHLTA